MTHGKNKNQKFTTIAHTNFVKALNMIDFAGILFAPNMFLDAIKRQLGLVK